MEWNGLLLKLIASKAGFEINVVVSELDENAKFPENVFEIPAEYSMSEK